MTPASAYRASAGIRYERRVAKEHVARGGSLTILIREQRPELQGVRLRTLLMWVPGIGPAKATRLLLGLPHYYPLRELEADERARLTTRLAAAERALINRQTHPYQET